MATTQNRTFYGGSTAPGSGVYPEDVKILKVYRNYAETDYDPLANSDTSVYIPTVEQVDSSGANIQVTIQKILAAGGYPVLVYANEEYQYVTTGGTPSKYVFTCLSDLSTLKRLEVDVGAGTISASSTTIAGANYIGRSASNIYTKIVNTFTQNRLPVIVDDSDFYQLSYAWNGMTRFTRVDEDDGSVHILSIDSSNTITETVVQGAEILKITKSDPEVSGLTVAEYNAISSAKLAVLHYGSGSTASYAHIQSYGNSTTFVHQTSTGYDIFAVAPVPTPVDPLDPDSELHHVVTKTSYTYGSSSMTMRNFEAVDATDSVNTHPAFPLGNDEFWVMEDWDGGWFNPNYYVMVAPSDTDNNCVVRFENVTIDTSYFTNGYPVEIWNHSKDAQLTPLDGSLTAMKADCSYEIRIYGDKYYCCEVWNAQNAPVTDAELQHAIDTLKSRIIYTIPLGAIDRIEAMSLPAQNTDVTVLATLFNPTMDQDLSNDSNVVLNFGPSQSNPNLLTFAIYQFISDSSDPNYRKWQWVANTSDVSPNNPLTGIMHFPLSYRSQTITKLSSNHLYLFCAIGQSTNNIECMGNELAEYINMNSASLALATGKQNQNGYTSVATLGTDIPYLDLTTFSESVVQGSGGKPARLFAAITNLTSLP